MTPSVVGVNAPRTPSPSNPFHKDATFSSPSQLLSTAANTTPPTGKVVAPAAPDLPLDGRTLNTSYYDGSANETAAAAAIPKPLTAAVNTVGE